MADVINAGTAAGARRLGFKLPAAGKTGTTNDFNDAWFIGFTPKLVTGVWVGFDHPQTILPNGFAADIAVPFWTAFMKVATVNDTPEWFTPPYGVTTAVVCRLSGKLASEGCDHAEVVGKDGQLETRSMVYTEYFSRGTEPTEYCDMHSANEGFGIVAGVFGEPPPATPNGTNAPPPAPSGTSGIFGLPSQPRPSSQPRSPGTVDSIGTSATSSTGSPAVPTDRIAPPPPDGERKSGFWSRILGRGGNDKKN
jgi:penicillin-binding protein 2D